MSFKGYASLCDTALVLRNRRQNQRVNILHANMFEVVVSAHRYGAPRPLLLPPRLPPLKPDITLCRGGQAEFLLLVCREIKTSTGGVVRVDRQPNKHSKKGFIETSDVLFWRGIYVDLSPESNNPKSKLTRQSSIVHHRQRPRHAEELSASRCCDRSVQSLLLPWRVWVLIHPGHPGTFFSEVEGIMLQSTEV